MTTFDLTRAKAIADAVLYEGYALYPYRASARKNRFRWQFGVAFPPDYARAAGEPASLGTLCFLEGDADTDLTVQARFLQLERRRIEVAQPDGQFLPVQELRLGEALYVTWDEGLEQVVTWTGCIGDALDEPVRVPFTFGPSLQQVLLTDRVGIAAGRLVRQREALTGMLCVQAEFVADRLVAVRAWVENQTAIAVADSAQLRRDQALCFALVGVHLLLGSAEGAFCSVVEPPDKVLERELSYVAQGLFPVLVGEPGERHLMLAAPIILYDYPQVAPESPRLLYDATEIDELLILRTLLLTDEEKQEARATDPRVAELLDQLESLPAERLARLHGAIRSWRVRQLAVDHPAFVGRRVRLRPALGRADAHDWFLADKTAIVEEVRTDVDGTTYVGVTLVDDPDADLLREWGRFWYFRLDEVEFLPEEAEGCESSSLA